ncbi:hypothetical protein J6590_010241 [Homalodisca vitripennis]|nr:hypothetical protein J6590_010241 [Homalodisca vitripennis]
MRTESKDKSVTSRRGHTVRVTARTGDWPDGRYFDGTTHYIRANSHPEDFIPLVVIFGLIMDEDRRKLLAVICLLRHRRKKKRNRSVWIHPVVVQKRNILGHFNTLFLELRVDEEKFFNYFRMSVSTFDEVLQKISPQDTNMRNCIKPAEMLAVTLR